MSTEYHNPIYKVSQPCLQSITTMSTKYHNHIYRVSQLRRSVSEKLTAIKSPNFVPFISDFNFVPVQSVCGSCWTQWPFVQSSSSPTFFCQILFLAFLRIYSVTAGLCRTQFPKRYCSTLHLLFHYRINQQPTTKDLCSTSVPSFCCAYLFVELVLC
jgi:hypothetical protein